MPSHRIELFVLGYEVRGHTFAFGSHDAMALWIIGLLEGNVGVSYGRGIWLSPQLGSRLLSIADVSTPHALETRAMR